MQKNNTGMLIRDGLILLGIAVIFATVFSLALLPLKKGKEADPLVTAINQGKLEKVKELLDEDYYRKTRRPGSFQEFIEQEKEAKKAAEKKNGEAQTEAEDGSIDEKDGGADEAETGGIGQKCRYLWRRWVTSEKLPPTFQEYLHSRTERKDETGRTPLMWAAYANYAPVTPKSKQAEPAAPPTVTKHETEQTTETRTAKGANVQVAVKTEKKSVTKTETAAGTTTVTTTKTRKETRTLHKSVFFHPPFLFGHAPANGIPSAEEMLVAWKLGEGGKEGKESKKEDPAAQEIENILNKKSLDWSVKKWAFLVYPALRPVPEVTAETKTETLTEPKPGSTPDDKRTPRKQKDAKNVPIVEELIRAGADVNARDNDGWTALMWASWSGLTKIAAALADHKADVNVLDRQGNSALTVAAMRGNAAIVKLLLEKGAKATGHDLETVCKAAEQYPKRKARYDEILAMLKKAGEPAK